VKGTAVMPPYVLETFYASYWGLPKYLLN